MDEKSEEISCRFLERRTERFLLPAKTTGTVSFFLCMKTNFFC